MAVQLIERPPSEPKGITFEDYLQMEETMQRYDILDGVMIMSPAPTDDHQLDLESLYDIVKPYVKQHDLGAVLVSPMDLIIRKLPALRTRQPDLAYFSWQSIGGKGREALRAARRRGVAPDLAVEVLSPDQGKTYMARKLRDYASIAVPEVWLASREAMTVEVLTLSVEVYERSGLFASGEPIRSKVLPGLSFIVESIFED